MRKLTGVNDFPREKCCQGCHFSLSSFLSMKKYFYLSFYIITEATEINSLQSNCWIKNIFSLEKQQRAKNDSCQWFRSNKTSPSSMPFVVFIFRILFSTLLNLHCNFNSTRFSMFRDTLYTVYKYIYIHIRKKYRST